MLTVIDRLLSCQGFGLGGFRWLVGLSSLRCLLIQASPISDPGTSHVVLGVPSRVVPWEDDRGRGRHHTTLIIIRQFRIDPNTTRKINPPSNNNTTIQTHYLALFDIWSVLIILRTPPNSFLKMLNKRKDITSSLNTNSYIQSFLHFSVHPISKSFSPEDFSWFVNFNFMPTSLWLLLSAYCRV